jgi:hypothetical protein
MFPGLLEPANRICTSRWSWEKLEHFGVIKEVVDEVELLQRAVEKHLEALRAGKTSLLISPRHEEARKVAALVRQKLKAEGAVGPEDQPVTVLRRMDLGSEARRDLLRYATSPEGNTSEIVVSD